jgi:hypothetical protein
MGSGTSWFAKMFSQDRRRADRKPSSEMFAYFWTGSTPVRHPVRDISETGMYLLTEERWHPGTVLMMTLQNPHETSESERVIAVQSKAVRAGEDGVGIAFVLPKDEKKHFGGGREGADRKSMTAFLERFWKKNGS